MSHYSMTFFAKQVEALLDHLEIDEAVVGGTSLGANVTLELADLAPERVRGMMVEMPVLDNALLAVGGDLHADDGRPALRRAAAAGCSRRLPGASRARNPLIDMGLDWIRQDPAPSSAVLEGLFLGSSAPHHQFRVEMNQPTLVIGHHADPLHPFSDSGMLAEELPNARLIEANSILEWRLSAGAPGRRARRLPRRGLGPGQRRQPEHRRRRAALEPPSLASAPDGHPQGREGATARAAARRRAGGALSAERRA